MCVCVVRVWVVSGCGTCCDECVCSCVCNKGVRVCGACGEGLRTVLFLRLCKPSCS